MHMGLYWCGTAACQLSLPPCWFKEHQHCSTHMHITCSHEKHVLDRVHTVFWQQLAIFAGICKQPSSSACIHSCIIDGGSYQQANCIFCIAAGQMWPRINAVATKRFHEFADPLIQQSKPSWVYHVEMQK